MQDQRETLTRGFYLDRWLVEPLKGTLTPLNTRHPGELGETDGVSGEEVAGETALHIEPKVMEVLLCLAAKSGSVVRRDELLEQVWGEVVVSEEVLTRCISELRSALGDNEKTRQYIQTLPKRGYRLLKPVELLSVEPPQSASPSPTDAKLSGDTMLDPKQGSASPAQASIPPGETPGTAPTEAAHRHDGKPLVGLYPAIMLLAAVGFAVLLFANRPDTVLEDANDRANDAVDETTSAALPLISNSEHTVAVLPFVNLSGDETTDSFADGLTADIRNTLVMAAGGEIPVVARTSSEAFRGRAIDIRSIGQQLGASRIIEGTVRIADERVRVTAQLTSTATGFPEWAQRFEYNLNDGLQIQSMIADRIAAELVPENNTTIASEVYGRQTDLEAYDYYLLGRHHWNRRTVDSLQLAQQYFQQALDADPDYALALSGLADSLVLELDYSGQHRDSQIERARTLANQALQLQPGLAEAHASLGLVHSYRHADLAAAEQSYRKAISAKPSYAMAHMWLGNALMDSNRVTEAFVEYSAALQFDPLNMVVRSNHLRGLSMQGKYAAASETAARYFAENPSDSLLKSWMSNMLQAGDYDQLLKFAVRHSFSAEYAGYGTEIVIEALTNLQRFEDAANLYHQFAADSGQSAKAWHLASLATNERNPQTLRDAAALMENDMTSDNPFKDCKDSLGKYWRGVADYLDGDFASAARFTESALSDQQSKCMRELTRRAEITAYLSDALKKSGRNQRAEELARESLSLINRSMEQGRRGLDMSIVKLMLLLTLGEADAAREHLEMMNGENWQYYATLAAKPIFSQFMAQLEPSLVASREKFVGMQEASRGIGLTKFGL